jgi:hypothetical protein
MSTAVLLLGNSLMHKEIIVWHYRERMGNFTTSFWPTVGQQKLDWQWNQQTYSLTH